MKITFIGAGSTVFARNVIGDCILTPELGEFDVCLFDIDAQRLEESYQILSNINATANGKAHITRTLDRETAFKGADFVVNAIQVGGYEPCTVTDFEIPKKYGLRQTIADTLGIEGLRRRHGALVPQRFVLELHQPHGYAVRLYAALHQHSNCRPVPFCPGLRQRTVTDPGHG